MPTFNELKNNGTVFFSKRSWPKGERFIPIFCDRDGDYFGINQDQDLQSTWCFHEEETARRHD